METKDIKIGIYGAVLGAIATIIVTAMFIAEQRLTDAQIKEAIANAKEENIKLLHAYIDDAAKAKVSVEAHLEEATKKAKYIDIQASTAEKIIENLNEKTDLKPQDVALALKPIFEEEFQKLVASSIDVKRVSHCKEAPITDNWVGHEVSCPAGYKVIGGGCDISDWIEQVGRNGPSSDFTKWQCAGRGTINHKVNICPRAVCLKSST